LPGNHHGRSGPRNPGSQQPHANLIGIGTRLGLSKAKFDAKLPTTVNLFSAASHGSTPSTLPKPKACQAASP
jgi:hypothetical protein